MFIVRFRKEEDAKHLRRKVKKMREEIEDVEDMLKECVEDAVNYRDDMDYDDDDRRMRRNERMSDVRYRRGNM